MSGTFWAFVPAIVAIGLALLTKKVYPSLFIGIFVGAMLYANGNIMNHNNEGTPVNANGTEIYFQDGGWFGSDKLTDGTNTYTRYRPDAQYWEGVTIN